jgi:hypothetical protein
MKKIILIAVLLAFLPSSALALSCSIATSCSGVTAFKISSTTNAHAELPTQTNYGYYVCCSGTGLGNSCSGTYTQVLKLSSTTNAHVEKKSYTNYGSAICLSISGGSIDCQYETNCANLGTNYVCLASISSDTNAHVGDCNAYSTKICCAATVCGNNVVESGEECEMPNTNPPSNPSSTCPSDGNVCLGSNRCGGGEGDSRYFRDYFCGSNCLCRYTDTFIENCRCDATDTDGGINYVSKGTCTDYGGCFSGSCQSSSYTDYCIDARTLREYYVSGSGDSAVCSYIDYNTEPYACKDGKRSTSCTSNDDCAPNYVCDLNDNKCKKCSSSHVETLGDSPDNLCEAGDTGARCTAGNRGSWCTALQECDELTPLTNISYCTKGGESYFADRCSLSCIGEDRDNICRSSAFAPDCTAIAECNGLTPLTSISYCNKGGCSGYADRCSLSCSGEDRDNICRVAGSIGASDGCTASNECSNIIGGRCSLEQGGRSKGYCEACGCSFKGPEESEEGCNCNVAGSRNLTVPSPLIGDANKNPWNSFGWKGDFQEKCCGNNITKNGAQSTEFLLNPICSWDVSKYACSGKNVGSREFCAGRQDLGMGCWRINVTGNDVTDCCDSKEKCVWRDNCYSSGYTGNVGELSYNITCIGGSGTWYDNPYFVESEFKFSGTLDYFNVNWVVDYPFKDREVSVNCTFYGAAEQRCEPYPFVHSSTPAKGACSVKSPKYNLTGNNRIVCTAYDPYVEVNGNYPISTKINHYFVPFNFTVSVATSVAAKLGEIIQLPIVIKNSGIVPSNYTVNYSSKSDGVYISNLPIVTREFGSGDSEKAYATIMVLYLRPSQYVDITVTDISNRQISQHVDIKTGYISLDEFGAVEALIIIFSVCILCWKKFYRHLIQAFQN